MKGRRRGQDMGGGQGAQVSAHSLPGYVWQITVGGEGAQDRVRRSGRISYLSGRSMGIRLRKSDGRAMASTYTGGVALFAHKAHHFEGGSSIFHWFWGVGVEKSEKIAVSRGARLCAHGQDCMC